MGDSLRSIHQLVRSILVLMLLGLPSMTSALAFEGGEDLVGRMLVHEQVEIVTASVFRKGKGFPLPTFVKEQLFVTRTPVSEKVLETMRGGFQAGPNGPFMSFGIERSVFLNDKLVSSISFAIPDVARFAANPSNTFTLVQVGRGNSVPQDLASLPQFMTVLQNSLDHQAIQTHTVINATVAALSWARSLDLGHALAQANLDALRH